MADCCWLSLCCWTKTTHLQILTKIKIFTSVSMTDIPNSSYDRETFTFSKMTLSSSDILKRKNWWRWFQWRYLTSTTVKMRFRGIRVTWQLRIWYMNELQRLLAKNSVVLFFNMCYQTKISRTGNKGYTAKNDYQIRKVCNYSTSRCDRDVRFSHFQIYVHYHLTRKHGFIFLFLL